MECKIFLTSLTEYNKGIIDGEWIDLTDTKAIENLDKFRREREGHEFLIADSSASVPMKISENDDPYELFGLVGRLKDLDETQLEAYETIMHELGWEREEALDKAESWEFDVINWDCASIEKAVGYYYAELNGYTDNDDYIISRYFDYEAYGHDICLENDVCDNGKTIFVIY